MSVSKRVYVRVRTVRSCAHAHGHVAVLDRLGV